jgi:hypothetical protein
VIAVVLSELVAGQVTPIDRDQPEEDGVGAAPPVGGFAAGSLAIAARRRRGAEHCGRTGSGEKGTPAVQTGAGCES